MPYLSGRVLRQTTRTENSASSRFMRDQVAIEPVTEGEQLPEIQELAHAIWREHYPGIISPEQIEYMLQERYNLDTLRRDLTQGQIRYDRALIDGTLVGFSAYGPHSDAGALMLHQLYVDSARRGCGCARILVEAASEYARTHSFDRIVLRVNKGNHIAIAAYERIGFTKRGPIVSDIGGGFCMDDYLMQLDL
jgi:ribosomal protein S18 acetylase RimI-like enzyme